MFFSLSDALLDLNPSGENDLPVVVLLFAYNFIFTMHIHNTVHGKYLVGENFGRKVIGEEKFSE